MAFTNILVHVDSTQAAATRVGVAATLAAARKARVTGLYVRPNAKVPLLASSAVGPQLAELLQADADLQAKQMQDAFLSLVAPVCAAEWIDVPGSLTDTVVTQAR